MFSLSLNERLYYQFDIFNPGSVIYIVRTNVKRKEDVLPYLKLITEYIARICILHNLQYFVLHNVFSPLNLEESMRLEEEVHKQIQSHSVSLT